MSKGLEMLKEIKEQLIKEIDFVAAHNDTFRAMYCLKTKEDFERYVDNVRGVKFIEKELQALAIIKEHWNFEYLKSGFGSKGLVQIKPISMEDADLLTEVLL